VAPTGIVATGDIGSGFNGHMWLEIAQHCERNKNRVAAGEERWFGVARRLRYKPATHCRAPCTLRA
jgi:hypothetical protein